MSDLTVVGKVVKIGQPDVNEEYQSQTCEFVIEIPNEYQPDRPKYAVFEMYSKIDAEHDNVGNLIKFNKVGDEVEVSYNLDGFTWKAKKDTKWNKAGDSCYMNKLKAWKVMKVTKDEVQSDAQVPDMEFDAAPF